MCASWEGREFSGLTLQLGLHETFSPCPDILIFLLHLACHKRSGHGFCTVPYNFHLLPRELWQTSPSQGNVHPSHGVDCNRDFLHPNDMRREGGISLSRLGSFSFRHYGDTISVFKGQFLSWILLVWCSLAPCYGLELGSVRGTGMHSYLCDYNQSSSGTHPRFQSVEHWNVCPVGQKASCLIMWVKNIWVCWFVILKLVLYYRNLDSWFSL